MYNRGLDRSKHGGSVYNLNDFNKHNNVPKVVSE